MLETLHKLLELPLLLTSQVASEQDWILGVLVTLLSLCGLVRLSLRARQDERSQFADLSLRFLWYVMLCAFAWLPFCLWPVLVNAAPGLDWLGGHLNSGRSIEALPRISVMLLVLTLVTVRPASGRRLTTIARTTVVVIAVTVLAAIVFWNATLISGLVLQAVIATESSVTPRCCGAPFPTRADHVHEVAADIQVAAITGLAVFCLSAVTVFWYARTNRFLAKWLTALSCGGFVCMSFYLEAVVAAPLTESLPPLLFFRDYRLQLAAFFVALPVSGAIGCWLATQTNLRYSIENSQRGEDLLNRIEQVLVGALVVNFVLLGWDVFLVGQFDSVFSITATLFSCIFTFGRWLDMVWSSRIIKPTTYPRNVSVLRILTMSILVAIQLVSLSVTISWLSLTFFLPMP